MSELYLRYQETQKCISDDGKEWGWSEYTIEWKPISLHKKISQDKKEHFGGTNIEEIQTALDISKLSKVWMVVVRYTNGGTFCSTNGYWKIIDLFKTDDEAYRLVKEIHDGGGPEYKPWKGYFAHLNDVEVHRMEID